LGAIIVISISSYLVIAVIAIVAIIYFRLQKFYRKSSRDLRRLEAIYKSPVGNILMDCLANAPTIRAQNLRINFEDHIANAIDNSQRVSLTSAVAGQWLTIRLQCLGILVTFSLAVVAVFNAVYKVAPVSASMLGLSLSYAFALVGYLNGLVNSVIESEQEMISVERMDEYIQLPSEYTSYDLDYEDNGDLNQRIATGSIGQARPDDNWPMNGSIVLSHVSFSYDKEKRFRLPANPEESNALSRAKRMMLSKLSAGARSLGGYNHLDDVHGNSDDEDEEETTKEGVQYALKDMSVIIAAGSRVAVVGRTGVIFLILILRHLIALWHHAGSGKSSFLRLLLNLNKCFDGRVTIGGLDIRDVSKKMLRKHCGEYLITLACHIAN
jgi:ABC-type multidrug transport system fused ATPase/permease subunit